jgi:hypothetical protein
MRRIEVRAQSKTSAAPARVFALLKDGSTWPLWGPFKSFELERPGHTDPYGVGSVRVFATRVTKTREEVVELVAGRRLSYTLLSGLPFLDYRADVDLEALPGGGCSIRWRSSFRAKQMATGWFWSWLMTRTLRTVAAQLATGAADPTIAPDAAPQS